MPNVSAASPRKRRLLGNVVHSLLLFGAPIWADRMSSKGKAEMAKVQRKTSLRVISAYCSVSEDAVLVLSSMPPIDLLAIDRKYNFMHKVDTNARTINHQDMIVNWQARWDASTKGRWTHRLIPKIEPWFKRIHGDANFRLTQVLSGHGCFPAYLHRFGILDSPNCWYCNSILFLYVMLGKPKGRESTLCLTPRSPPTT